MVDLIPAGHSEKPPYGGMNVDECDFGAVCVRAVISGAETPSPETAAGSRRQSLLRSAG